MECCLLSLQMKQRKSFAIKVLIERFQWITLYKRFVAISHRTIYEYFFYVLNSRPILFQGKSGIRMGLILTHPITMGIKTNCHKVTDFDSICEY
jgi:hypothetical protein